MALPAIGSTLANGLDTDIDPATGLPKQKTATQPTTFQPLATTAPGQNAALDIQNPAALQAPPQPAAGGFDPNAALGTQVVKKAQETALQGAPTQTQSQVSQLTQALLNDPNAGVDYGKYNQQQLENFDYNQQKALEALRQKTGDVSNTGANLGALTATALQTGVDRANLANQLNKESMEANRNNLISALSAGQQTQAGELANYNATLAGLASAQQTGSQASDQAFQWAMKGSDQEFSKDMQEMQNKFTTNERLSAQDFTSYQASLDRQMELAKQNNDIEAQQNLAILQNKLDMQRDKQNQDFQVQLKDMDTDSQKELMNLKAQIDSGAVLQAQDFEKTMTILKDQLAQAMADKDTAKQIQILKLTQEFEADEATKTREWQTGERVASQAWQSSERVATEDFTSAENVLDRKLELAKQANDIEAQKYIQQQQAQLELAKQTNGFSQEEKMAYINEQIAESKAKNDFARTTQLQSMQNQFEFDKLDREQGHDVAMANLNEKIQIALQNNDNENAVNLQKMAFAQQTMEADKDRALEQLKIDLQAKGLDMTQWEQTYNAIMAQEEAGTAEPGSARDYLNAQLKDSGVQLEAPDPADEYKAISEAFKQQQYQYLLTHPEAQDPQQKADQDYAKTVLNSLDNPDVVDKLGGADAAKQWAESKLAEDPIMSNAGIAAFNGIVNEANLGETGDSGTSLIGKTGDDLKSSLDALLKNASPDEVWSTYKDRVGDKMSPEIVDALISSGSAQAKSDALDAIKNGTMIADKTMINMIYKDGYGITTEPKVNGNTIKFTDNNGDQSKETYDKTKAALVGKFLTIGSTTYYIKSMGGEYVDPIGPKDYRNYSMTMVDTSTGKTVTKTWKQGDY